MGGLRKRRRKIRDTLSYHVRPGLYNRLMEGRIEPHAFHAIEGSTHRVLFPFRYGSVFKRGDLVMEMHLRATTKSQLDTLIQTLKKDSPMLRDMGIKGIVGVTPNTLLIHKVKRLGGKILPVNPIRQWLVRKSYQKGVNQSGFSPRYTTTPIRRIVLTLDQIEA